MTSPLYAVLELVPERRSELARFAATGSDDEDTVVTPADADVDEIAARWLRVAVDFEKLLGGHPATRVLEIPHEGKTAKVTVRLGSGLLQDLIYAYGIFGCPGLDAALAEPSNPNDARRLARAPDERVTTFLTQTHRVVTDLIIVGLDRIERAGIAFAKRQWTAAAKNLDEYEALTRPPREDEGSSRQFRNFWFGVEAYQECAYFAGHRRAYNRVEEDMGKWPVSQGKDPHSPFRPLWKAKEREKAAILKDLKRSVRSVGTFCPGLLLALEKLDDDFGQDPEDKNADKKELADHLYFQVRSLRADTEKLLAGLNEGPHAKKELAFAVQPGGQQKVRAAGGLEKWLLNEVLADNTEQRVLLNDTQLRDLANPESPTSPIKQGTWEWFVLGVHLREMRAITEEKAAKEAKFRIIWDWLVRIVALLSVVAFAIATFGAGAALAAGGAAATFLATAGTVVTVLALSMTAIEAAYRLTVERATLTQEISDQLHLLAVSDPDAMASIGHLLTARQAIATGLLKEFALMALTMGASKIKRIARALDIYGAIDDMQTLFAPLPTSTPAASPTAATP